MRQLLWVIADGSASRVRYATLSGADVKRTARRAAGSAQENPLDLAIGAAAIGLLAGMAFPSTRVEDERLGPAADQAKTGVKQTGQQALERGKQVARRRPAAPPRPPGGAASS
jgi:hypothetical protein